MKRKPIKLRLGQNIRRLRELKKLSIEYLADELGISTSGLYSYESGRTEPDAAMLIRISGFFMVSIDALIKGDLYRTDPARLMNVGPNRILFPVTLDAEGNDAIELVPVKATAGYSTGYSDPEYITSLPAFQLPFLSQQKKYRAFQIQGDSMLPVPSGSYIIGEYIEDLRELKDGQLYVLLLPDSGLVFKMAFKSKNRKMLLLRSLNPAFEPYETEWAGIREAWKFVNYISSELPSTGSPDVFGKLVELEKQVAVIREKVSK